MTLVEKLLEGDGAEESLYDKLSHSNHPGVDDFMTVVSQIYNGGVQQIADHNHMEEFDDTINFLSGVPGRNAKHFAGLMRGCSQSLDKYLRDSKRDRHGNLPEIDGERYFGEGSPGDVLEDWLYDSRNSEALFSEVLQSIS